jgi:chromosome segregation ATPase
MVVSGGETIAGPSLAAPPSGISRARERVITRMVADFMSFLRESVSSVLDDGCPFSEFKPALTMYLTNLSSVTSVEFVEPYHSQLRRVERDLREWDRLRTLNLEEVASAKVETVVAERAKFLAWTEEESEALLGKIVFLHARRQLDEEERTAARITMQAQTETIARANRIIADAQAMLTRTKRDYEQVMGRLEELEVEASERAASLQTHEDELARVNARAGEFLSVPEEELHQIALGDAWNETLAKLQPVEERLRSIGGAAHPPPGLS